MNVHPKRALTAMLAVFSLALLLLGAAPAEGAFRGANGKIAFDKGRSSGVVDLYVINADGSGEALLAADARSPAWSSDGTKIAFGKIGAGGGISVMNADGSGVTQLTTEGITQYTNPTWSPDGKIAFSRGNRIWVMNSDGSGLTQLTFGPRFDVRPSWSPDGTKIAFEANDGSGWDIWVMNADGSAPTKLTNTTGAFAPDWSPDGTRIAFSANVGLSSESSVEIFVMNADGSGQTRLTISAGGTVNWAPAWSPDGMKIAFDVSDPGDGLSGRVIVMNADGSGLTQLADAGFRFLTADWQPVLDSDGDGLLDSWERNGIDVDLDGTIDLDLPAMGADPMHKDIFLEIDSMAGHGLSQAAVDLVVEAFAAAPVANLNPDGLVGVTLHVDNGPASIMDPASGQAWGGLSDADTIAHQPVLGTDLANGVYDWSAFDAVKAANFSDARKLAFHYVVSGHRYAAATQDSAGISRGTGASDLLVTLGPASEPGEGSGTVAQQAGTLMHELGHNLGLRHGGNDDTNYKPSYLSIMNYWFTFTGLKRANGTFVLDYSQTPVSLDEGFLDEDNGFGFAAGSAQAQFVSLAYCQNSPPPPNGTLFLTPLAAGPVDWDCDGVTQGQVAADVNGDGQLSQFSPFLDWPALVYDGGAIGDAGSSVLLPQATEMNEPQLEELLASARVLEGALDTTAPTLTVPGDITVDATGPNGATVDYTASASDGTDPSPTLECAPASGSVFAIGTTTVTCTATDDAGNQTSARFGVHVRGASEQIAGLIDKTLAYLDLRALEPTLRDKLQALADALATKKPAATCLALKLYIAAVKLAPSKAFTPVERAELIADATRIRAVIGCT
jgi:Tol biopolymer transport system component